MHHLPAIAVCADAATPATLARAAALSAELHLPLIDAQAGASGRAADLLLACTPGRLELRRGRTAVWADFAAGRLAHRRRQPAGGASMLLRAVGFKPGAGQSLHVCDATAGLARDAFLLAAAGCRVTAVERSAVLAVLVRDGLERAGRLPDLRPIVAGRLTLLSADARDLLADWPGRVGGRPPDVVYLDPMFPPGGESAAAKKEMALARLVAGDDPDAGELLALARSLATARVVVKRALRSPLLAPGVAFTYRGTTIRYDIYLPER